MWCLWNDAINRLICWSYLNGWVTLYFIYIYFVGNLNLAGGRFINSEKKKSRITLGLKDCLKLLPVLKVDSHDGPWKLSIQVWCILRVHFQSWKEFWAILKCETDSNSYIYHFKYMSFYSKVWISCEYFKWDRNMIILWELKGRFCLQKTPRFFHQFLTFCRCKNESHSFDYFRYFTWTITNKRCRVRRDFYIFR